jgi:hypothetical protein
MRFGWGKDERPAILAKTRGEYKNMPPKTMHDGGG